MPLPMFSPHILIFFCVRFSCNGFFGLATFFKLDKVFFSLFFLRVSSFPEWLCKFFFGIIFPRSTFWYEFMNFCLILTFFCFFVYSSHVAFDWVSQHVFSTFFTLAEDLFSLFFLQVSCFLVPSQIFLCHTFSTFRTFNNKQQTFWKEFMNFCLILTFFLNNTPTSKI